MTSVSSPIYYLIKGNYGLDIQREIRRGEGSLHPQPEGWGIRDPLRSRSNKLISYNQVLTTMTDETTLCPCCGQGILDSEEIKDFPNGEHIEIHYYSCGHKHDYIETSEGVVVKDVLGKIVLFGGDKIGKKKYEYEIEERYRNDDIDRPGTQTVEFVCINHRTNPTSAFHIVKYIETNELKHIDCKTCNNKWQHELGSPLESHFEVEHNPEADSLYSLKIECLKCNAKYKKFI